ncbi:hypothetical protein LCGC14_0676930 [marine sediment metagenome]|uniref:Uncharacterized protein n=1 Tax=marine sediment metagenome TaxID=412755 RepID=A0A0F9QU88_9ZZZZ
MSPARPIFSGEITGKTITGKILFTFSTDPIIISDDKLIEEKFGLPLKEKQKCPACGIKGNITTLIAHLNNRKGETNNYFDLKNGAHDWSFKQIGMWLKELGY